MLEDPPLLRHSIKKSSPFVTGLLDSLPAAPPGSPNPSAVPEINDLLISAEPSLTIVEQLESKLMAAQLYCLAEESKESGELYVSSNFSSPALLTSYFHEVGTGVVML